MDPSKQAAQEAKQNDVYGSSMGDLHSQKQSTNPYHGYELKSMSMPEISLMQDKKLSQGPLPDMASKHGDSSVILGESKMGGQRM